MNELIFPMEIWNIIFKDFSWMNELSIHPLLELRQTCKYFHFIVDSYLKTKYNTNNIYKAIHAACEWAIIRSDKVIFYYKNFIHDTHNGLPAVVLYRHSNQEDNNKHQIIETIKHYKLGKLHNETDAAIKTYYSDKTLKSKIWLNNGVYVLGLSIIAYYPSGKLMAKCITYSRIDVSYFWKEDGILDYVKYKPTKKINEYNPSELPNHKEDYYKHLSKGLDNSIFVKYHQDGIAIEEEKYTKNGLYNRDDGPSIISYRKNFTLLREQWFVNSKYYRKEDEPTFISYHKDGSIDFKFYHNRIKYYDENIPVGIHYRPNGSIEDKTYYNKTEKIIIGYNEDEIIIFKRYYKDNKLHKEDGPALIEWYPCGKVKHEEYFNNGRLHNDHGPAIINYDINGNIIESFNYINGE